MIVSPPKYTLCGDYFRLAVNRNPDIHLQCYDFILCLHTSNTPIVSISWCLTKDAPETGPGLNAYHPKISSLPSMGPGGQT